eukprot:3204827-Rhodomonas_salina.1
MFHWSVAVGCSLYQMVCAETKESNCKYLVWKFHSLALVLGIIAVFLVIFREGGEVQAVSKRKNEASVTKS